MLSRLLLSLSLIGFLTGCGDRLDDVEGVYTGSLLIIDNGQSERHSIEIDVENRRMNSTFDIRDEDSGSVLYRVKSKVKSG